MDITARFTQVSALCAAMLLLAGCGVSKAQYLDLTQRHADLAAKNHELQSSLDTLSQEKAALEARVHDMETAAQEQQKESADAKSTYDALVGRLQNELKSGKLEIQKVRDGVSVNLQQDILFPSGSAKLDQKGAELLLKVAEELKTSPFEVVVNGHTDNFKIGESLAERYPTNWELGGARSARIVRLFEDAGISKKRLSAVSYSDSRPRKSNKSAEGRAKNRRIEIRLRPTVTEPTASK